jgi:diguanylate cyclase (GGDEF)-like protein
MLRRIVLVLLLCAVFRACPAAEWTVQSLVSAAPSCSVIDPVRTTTQDQWQPGLVAQGRISWFRLRSPEAASPRLLVANGPRTGTWWSHPDSATPVVRSRETDPQLALHWPRRFAFELSADSGWQYHCFEAGALRPLNFELEDPLRLAYRERNEWIALALTLGVMLAAGAFGGAYFLRLREPAYGYYALYVAGFVCYLLHLTDVLHELLPLSIRHRTASGVLGWMAMAWTAVSGLRFAFVFTNVDQRFPLIARTAGGLVAIISIGCVIGATLLVAGIGIPPILPLLINGSFVAIVALAMPVFLREAWQGQIQARYFVLGWTPLLLSIGLIAISAISGEAFDPSQNAVLLTAAMSSVALGLGLADVSGRWRDERDAARRDIERDALTGVLSRLALMKHLERAEPGSSLLYFDLDHFKRVNDFHGHPFGDRALRHFANIAGQHVRTIDRFGRIGGEEFVAILPGVDVRQAALVAQRIRRSLLAQPLDQLELSVSIGVAEREAGETAEQWLARADEALYRAKSLGRNRVEPAPPESSSS